ncbi:hypothetical protein Tco_0695432 [Tanacetum coccineum]
MFTSMRCISRHEDTQVYSTILPKELTNQAMLESNAYKAYYAFTSGEKTPKPKYVQKKVDSNTLPKLKPVQATKGTRIKSKSKVSKSNKKKQPAKNSKAKGLVVLSEVALTEAEQLKLATKRSKTQFSLALNTSGGDSDKEDDDEDDFEDDVDNNDDHSNDNDESDDERTESDRDEIPDPNKTNKEHNKEEEEYDDEFNIEEEEERLLMKNR